MAKRRPRGFENHRRDSRPAAKLKECLQELGKAGANFDFQDNKGRTPAMLAAAREIRLPVGPRNAGANLDAFDFEGCPAANLARD